MHFKIFGSAFNDMCSRKTMRKETRKTAHCQKTKQLIKPDSKNDPVTGTIREEIQISSG